jgi:hypothetical protein
VPPAPTTFSITIAGVRHCSAMRDTIRRSAGRERHDQRMPRRG